MIASESRISTVPQIFGSNSRESNRITAAREFAERVSLVGLRVRRVGPDKYVSQCPAHDDRHPSYSFTTGRRRSVVGHCFAGCSQLAIRDAFSKLEIHFGMSVRPETATERDARQRARRIREMHAQACRRAFDTERELETAVRRYGAVLARQPDGTTAPELTEIFHLSCRALVDAALESSHLIRLGQRRQRVPGPQVAGGDARVA